MTFVVVVVIVVPVFMPNKNCYFCFSSFYSFSFCTVFIVFIICGVCISSSATVHCINLQGGSKEIGLFKML